MTAAGLLNVLIVDDSAPSERFFRGVLRQTDLPLGEIKEAGSGTEAVEILKERSFGLILSDINMPQMDRLQLLARIREMDHLRSVPVIMITTEGGGGKCSKQSSWARGAACANRLQRIGSKKNSQASSKPKKLWPPDRR